MFFPEARHAECSGNSCWKHQELWMLVRLLRELVPQVSSKTPPSAPPRFTLYPIQHVCFTLLLFQPSLSLNNYLSSSYFASFSPTALSQRPPPFFANFALLHSLYLCTPIHPPLSSLPLHRTSSCLRSLSYSLSTGVRRQPGNLNASTMTGVGSGCLAVSNDFFMTGV